VIALVTDAAAQVGGLYLVLAVLWLLADALESRLARRDAARRQLAQYRQRVWR
jgi:hypothetical protein